MRWSTVSAGNIKIARLECLSNTKQETEIWVNTMTFDAEGTMNNITELFRRAFELCTIEWGLDNQWRDVGTHVECRYSIYQYDMGLGDLIEVSD